MSHRVRMEENTGESAATVAADSFSGTQGWNTLTEEGGEGVSGKSGSLKESNRAMLLVSWPSVCEKRMHTAQVKPLRFPVQLWCTDVAGISVDGNLITEVC